MCAADTYDKIALLRLAYRGLEDDELQEMAKRSQFKDYPAGHVLCREGAYEDVDWQAHIEGIRQNLSFPGATEWWQSRKKAYPPVFVAELQSYGI